MEVGDILCHDGLGQGKVARILPGKVQVSFGDDLHWYAHPLAMERGLLYRPGQKPKPPMKEVAKIVADDVDADEAQQEAQAKEEAEAEFLAKMEAEFQVEEEDLPREAGESSDDSSSQELSWSLLMGAQAESEQTPAAMEVADDDSMDALADLLGD